MKRYLASLLFAVIAVSPPILAQMAGPFTITSSTSPCATIAVTGQSTVGISVTGTFSATLQPEVSIRGQAPANTQVTPSTSSTAQSTITSTGVYTSQVAGVDTFLLCATSYTSGTATIYLNATKAAALGGGGGSGGSGTVSANNGSAGAIANYAAAGGSTTVGPDATLKDSGTILTYSGTTIQGPNGSALNPTYSFANSTTSGMYLTNSTNLTFSLGNTKYMNINGGTLGVTLGSNGLSFTNSATDATATTDTAITRPAPALLSFGSGGALGNETAFARSANSCATSSDISLTVNTATNICSFSLPALSKVWIVHCDLPWAITAGSGTNTMAIGVNASQTPAGTTNLTGKVYNATATSPTYAATALSASGALSIVTGATYTPGATVQTASLDGAINASGTAGTFAITMTAAGTTATAAAKAGAYCRLE